jgi:hypothetical protein
MRAQPLYGALLLGVLVVGAAGGAATADVSAQAHGGPAASDEPADISAVKDKLIVLGDGKKHYLALLPSTDMEAPFFYGNGKAFYAQRVFGGGGEGKEGEMPKAIDKVFWEPRSHQGHAYFNYRDGKYSIGCDKRETVFTPLPDGEMKTMISAAKFYKPHWKYRAYALARDNKGVYYYVDRVREPESSMSFRLWAGPRGAMKPQKMVNVVSDSEGDIFATKSGELRLVLDKHETTWIKNEQKTKLVFLPVEENHVLIYTDLGVYTGEPLGTPCDDL